MKWLTLYLVLAITISSCRDDGLAPRQKRQLHKTWLQTQSLRDGRDVILNRAYALRVEFLRNGQLLYGTAKESGGCCKPSLFDIEGESITFTIDASDPTLFCAQSLCSSSSELTTGVRWQVTALTDDKLILTNEQTTLIFEPAP
ncbi:hypothetical protein [Spirosoma arcticum]